MNPIAIRLLNQQLICPQFNNPEDVVKEMSAASTGYFKLTYAYSEAL